MAVASVKEEENVSLVSRQNPPSERPAQTSSSQQNFVWKGVATILVVAALLLAMDSFEMKGVEKNGRIGNATSSVGMDGVVEAKPTASPTHTTSANTQGASPTASNSIGGNSASSHPPTDPELIIEPWYTYVPRGQPLTDQERQDIIDKWGSWTLVDAKRDQRPQEDFFARYPYRDVPRAEFPPTAWQLDKEYLDQFFPEALALVDRAQEAILAEYGKEGPKDTFLQRSNMFKVEIMETWENEQLGDRSSRQQGGFTNRKSWDGFVRRILHAIVSQDSFVFAMGGHSAAAAHGNHFVQSYTIQVQWILESVFARLGVRHQARNFGMGGLGTVHNALGSGSIYGPDVDVLMWDSSMTEKDAASQDLFHRQYILGGGKVPILWSLALSTLKHLHLNADVDVGMVGEGNQGLTLAKNVEELDAQPWAARYLKCDNELKKICGAHEYSGTCWINRDDFTPNVTQANAPGGRASWHPGNRRHQLRGRVLAFTILSGLRDALNLWKDAEGYVLADEMWHVKDYYEKIRAKVAADKGPCHEKFGDAHLEFACKYPVKARTEFTPRAFPAWTKIRNLMPPEQRAILNPAPRNVYSPPDVFNPHLHPPKGSVDVLNIVEQGVPFQPNLVPDYTSVYKMPTFPSAPSIPIGKGLHLNTKAGDVFCDGSATSFCSRNENGCMLYGHNDGRNGIAFDGYSGWIVMNIPDVKYGYIAVKYESWHKKDGNVATDGWESINNERRRLRESDAAILSSKGNSSHPQQQHSTDATTNHRLLKTKPAPYCNEFVFEYAVDGVVTTLNMTEWERRSQHVQRVVEVMTILEDPNYTSGVETQVEIAVRIRGCGRVKHFTLSHVYWA